MQLTLPASVKGMTELDREQFTQIVHVPFVNVPGECLNSSKWKNVLLVLHAFKNVRQLQGTLRQVLLDPDQVQSKADLIGHVPGIDEYVEQSFDFTAITITYENYTVEEVIKAIVPYDLFDDKRVNTGSGYSIIGHIAHFNLRDEVLPFKHVIGETRVGNETRLQAFCSASRSGQTFEHQDGRQ